MSFTLAEDAAIFGKTGDLAPLFSADPEGDALSFAFVGSEAQSNDQEARAMGVTATIGADNKITLSGKPDNLLENATVTFSVAASDESNAVERKILVAITADDDELEVVDRLFIFQEGEDVPTGATVVLNELFVDADTTIDFSTRVITFPTPLAGLGTDEGVNFTSSTAADKTTLTIAGAVKERSMDTEILVTVSLMGETELATITVRIRGDDDAPVLRAGKALTDLTLGLLRGTIDLNTYFEDPEDPENGKVTYSLGGTESVSGVVFSTISDAGELSAMGTLDADASFTVTATDAGGNANTFIVTLSAASRDFSDFRVDEAVAIGEKIGDPAMFFGAPAAGTVVSFAFVGDEATAGTDAQKASNQVAVALGVTATIGDDKLVTLSGTPDNLPANKVVTFSVTTNDGTTDVGSITVTILADDDAPELAPSPPSKALTVMEDMDVPMNTTVALGDFFTDPEGLVLRYAITTGGGAPSKPMALRLKLVMIGLWLV